ncbi:GNAT family N-acetyltransferase, partial [Pseudomonas aeruginosa]|nr:GNAT family N-acetyltransferase [Pseudomonas aeruginosa]
QALGVALPDWQPRPWPTRQVLQGSRCRLEPLTLAHASDLFAAHQLAPDARSWTWLLREPESNLAEFSAWVEQVATLADPINFAVVDQQRGKAVGSLALMRIDIAHGVVEVGHVHF